MGTREIPATFVRICDGCGIEHHATSKGRPPYWSELTLGRDAHDYQGAAVADATVRRDLCGQCTEAVANAINEAIKKRKTEKVDGR